MNKQMFSFRITYISFTTSTYLRLYVVVDGFRILWVWLVWPMTLNLGLNGLQVFKKNFS